MSSLVLSIIIVNYNGKRLLKDCLESILTRKGDFPFEIIIADNASSDGSLEMVGKYFGDRNEIKLIKNTENLGFAKANNQAIEIAQGKYILLLNNDTIVIKSDCFDKMVQFMEGNPKVGVLGCKLLFPDGSLQSFGEDFLSAWEIFKSQIFFSKTWRRLSRIYNTRTNGFWEVDYVSGACMMIRKNILNEVGLLKEDYFMYGEDMEFCYRVKKAGWKVGVLGNVEIIHLHSKSAEKNISEILYCSIKNSVENVRLLYGNKQALLAKFFYFIGLFIRAALAIFRKSRIPKDYLSCIRNLLSDRNR